ncbi:interleukin-22 receptor subunit alpha-1 [Dasypus novemcinctus]|uniref:interleukin-22 receptor subunit alpha-1 n=1 Tax=Dasypus novemcinctus TaxID=9361 RepID=UPI000328A35D|nr:interleukin-22 receptor subunit alpha-1 [Dasypus novemcinctus]
MRTLLAILVVGSLAAHVAEDTSGLLQDVKFQSSNFENILTWASGPEGAPDTVYSVEYKMYGEREWLAKAGCQRITRKSCNLTTETGNLTELYYARVTAVSTGGQQVTKMTGRFNSLMHTTIKPPDVTCIPNVRSVQMIIHPTFTPIHREDGHQLTLEDIFYDLCYRLELQVNQTYQMHLEGKQREYEFVALTPDTEFLGTIMISVPTWSKESTPYVCRVKTLPDRTWTYSFSGAFLFFMGFLVAAFCYLSYRYVTKPLRPPNSLNVQRVLTFQPLRFIQEHILIPAFDLGGPSSLDQTVQYSQVKVIGPELPAAPQQHCPPEGAYFREPDLCALWPSNRPPHQTLAPLSYAPQAAPELRAPSYMPQATPRAEPPFYTPQAVSEAQRTPSPPQAAPESWPSSYGVCVEGSGKDSPSGTLSRPKHPRSKGQLQKEVPAGSCTLDDFSLQVIEEPQEAKSFHHPLGGLIERTPGLHALRGGDPGTPGCLPGRLPLLSSVQLEGHPVCLPSHTPSPPCSPSGQGLSPWGLLESLVCPKDEGSGSETDAQDPAPQAADLEQPVELDTLFRGLALTVQWEP